MTALELTVLAKRDGPLTKRISLSDSGSLISDGSACVMSTGSARRVRIQSGARQLANLIEQLGPHQALALGRLRADLADDVEITTRHKLNGGDRPNLIARTKDYLVYRTSEPAFALIDFDQKGMPAEVAERKEQHGGLWPSLIAVLPALAGVTRVVRQSTSAGLYRDDTGERLVGSGGEHLFVLVQDGSDIERFLAVLHARCWRAGFGWYMIGAGGQLLERSIVDRVVGSPERLVFEGPPVLDPPLAQDQAARRPLAIEGEALDTVAACPPLTILEQSIIREQKAKLAARLNPKAEAARKDFVEQQLERHVMRGVTREQAARIIERQCAGVLLPFVVLPFDDDDLAGCTVSDVLANPDRFVDATLADPLEGIEYGITKAKIMRRSDGTLWVHSFAHGRTVYELKLDYSALKAAIEKAPVERAVATFLRLVLTAELTEDEVELLRNQTSEISGISRRSLDGQVKHARERQAQQRTLEQFERGIAERCDPRPQIRAPLPDAPWLPQMQTLNDVLGASSETEPPMRDIEGRIVQVRTRRVPSLHALTAYGANAEETDETRLPPPEQPLLYRLDEPALAELIERHIEYIDNTNRPVHLGAGFVKHYLARNDAVLPVATAVTTLPIVLPDGRILTGRGLNRRLGIVMRIPPELHDRLPQPHACTPDAVGNAMRYLTQEWLCDVSADYASRCILIACAMTILERVLLPERPAFFITAGQRGGGKTTALHMVATAALGHRAAAAAWSTNEDERRKALFAYFGEGVPFLVWDNLQRGAAVSCPSIEKALTIEHYSDRVLGVSETKTVPAYTVQAFAGNNVTARGDLASRALCCRIDIERPDPENRDFRHPDAIGWTEAHRGQILASLYTMMLGNPRRAKGRHPAPPTRFKAWFDLVGSAVEYGAEQQARIVAERVHGFVGDPDPLPAVAISFKEMFLAGEAEDEQANSLAIVLEVLRRRWPYGCQAAEVAYYAGAAEESAIAFRAALEHAAGKPMPMISATTVAWRLKSIKDAPMQVGNQVLTLKYKPDSSGHGGLFSVVAIDR